MVTHTHACSCGACRELVGVLAASSRQSDVLRKRIAAFCAELKCHVAPLDNLPPADRLPWIELPPSSCPNGAALRERIALAEAERIALAFTLFDLGGKIAYRWHTTRRQLGCSLKQLGISPRQLGVSSRQMRGQFRVPRVEPLAGWRAA